MQKRVAILAAIMVVVAPVLTTTPTEAAPAGAIWVDRQVLDDDGLYHVAIDGSTVVVADHEWRSGLGRVIVFERVGGLWVRQQTLFSPDTPPADRGDGFGFAVDVHENVIVVGQRHPWYRHGSAHVFEYRSGKWRHTARLSGVDGMDVTVWGRFIAASSWGRSDYPGATGKIAIFERLPAGWALSQTFRRGRDGHVGCMFGYALDMQRTVLVAADYRSHDPCAPAVHVFRRNGSTWSREQRLRTSGRGYLEGYTAVWNDTIAVGESDLTGTDTAHRARVRIFEWDGSRWIRAQTVRRNTQNFGDAVALHNDTLVVTDATLDRHWVFARTGGTWEKVGQFRDSGTARYVAVYYRHLISSDGKAIAYRLKA